VRGTTNPVPCCHLANDTEFFTDLLTSVVCAMAGDNKQIDLWPELTQNVVRSSHMVTPHLPWKFHANRSSRFLVMLLTKKQYPAPYRGRGNKIGVDVSRVSGMPINWIGQRSKSQDVKTREDMEWNFINQGLLVIYAKTVFRKGSSPNGITII